MTRITNVDQVLILLRNQLQKMEREKKSARPIKTPEAGQVHKTPFERVQDLAADGNLSEADIHRALIGSLLTEEFGTAIANDPSFQAIIDRVTATLTSDQASKQLLRGAVDTLKNAES